MDMDLLCFFARRLLDMFPRPGRTSLATKNLTMS